MCFEYLKGDCTGGMGMHCVVAAAERICLETTSHSFIHFWFRWLPLHMDGRTLTTANSVNNVSSRMGLRVTMLFVMSCAAEQRFVRREKSRAQDKRTTNKQVLTDELTQSTQKITSTRRFGPKNHSVRCSEFIIYYIERMS